MNTNQSSLSNKNKFIEFLVKRCFPIALTAFVLSYYFTALNLIAWVVWLAGMVGCILAFKETPKSKKILVTSVILAISFGNLLTWTMLSMPGIYGGWSIIQFSSLFYSIF